MVEKLRRKFIIICVGAVFTVLFFIAFFTNLSNYSQIGRNADELLNILVENDGYFPREKDHKPEYKLPPKMSPEAPFSTRFFTVKIDNAGNLIQVDTGKMASTSTKEAVQYTNKVLESNKIGGFMNNYKYTIAVKDYGYLLIFVDCGRDLQMFYSFLKSSITICVIGILAVFILVLIFSKRAIRPIVESYEKQKQFITDASHELKTPLAIINTNTEVLEIDYGQSQWTESIHNQVSRLSTLVEGLVSLTRMDEERNEFLKTDFSLSNLVIETVGQFQQLSKNYNKELLLQIEKDVFYYGNEEAIMQLISILIDNALKYSLKDSVITISLKKQGKRYILETTNEVENLPIGNYNMLFERFYRLDNSRNRKLGGYGIGLSIGKAIVLKHKGKITAESHNGRTIIFSVQL
jgi:signal transduction histidine kinase